MTIEREYSLFISEKCELTYTPFLWTNTTNTSCYVKTTACRTLKPKVVCWIRRWIFFIAIYYLISIILLQTILMLHWAQTCNYCTRRFLYLTLHTYGTFYYISTIWNIFHLSVCAWCKWTFFKTIMVPWLTVQICVWTFWNLNLKTNK